MNLAYDDRGSGDPVLFIAGRGGAGRTWHLHQVPEFLRAGYRCLTFDNRGIGATEAADGFTTDTMVGDTAALIEKLDVAPVRIVAVSMGAYIAQELMMARPELVSSAVLAEFYSRLVIPAAVRDWIDMFTMWPAKPTPGLKTQLGIGPRQPAAGLPKYYRAGAGDRVRRRRRAAAAPGR